MTATIILKAPSSKFGLIVLNKGDAVKGNMLEIQQCPKYEGIAPTITLNTETWVVVEAVK